MALEKMDTSPTRYVVLDVETNGLKSKEDDLLFISILKPDDGRTYNRFLPLELNSAVYTTDINGITKADLKSKQPLTQAEVDNLFADFELDQRIILHYGALDYRFVRDYFTRHNLAGFDRLHFFNFKRLICSTKWSDGSLTKDNFCDFFGIEGVNNVHSGMNDCALEWELFKKLDGRYLLAHITPCGPHVGQWRLSILNSGYILPISYLTTYANLDRIIERPYICCESTTVYSLEIARELIKRFPSNYSGMTIEHLIDTMLGVTKEDNSAFLAQNAAKNELLGYMPSYLHITPMSFNADGTVTAAHKEDKPLEIALNATIKELRRQITPLVEFVREEIFHGQPITSQELVIDDDRGILALCDLSSPDAILEIKTSSCNPEWHAEQLYYEAHGRTSYLLGMNWDSEPMTITIKQVDTFPGVKPDKRRERVMAALEETLRKEDISLVSYASSQEPIEIRCRVCEHRWTERYARIKSGKCVCPICHPDRYIEPRQKRSMSTPHKQQVAKLSPEEAMAKRATRLADKVSERSHGHLVIDQSSYTGARENVTVRCKACGYTWSVRTDHLLGRCHCPKCKSGA